MGLRHPTADEIRILDFLISSAEGCIISKDWSVTLMVVEINDGNMGSLRLFPNGIEAADRTFSVQASECQFTDEDDIEVIAFLNLDQFGDLYELDIWKVNFEKLIRVPTDMAALRPMS
jgi:hypothetical protein